MKKVTPIHLLNPNNYKVPKSIQEKRLDFCKECKFFKDKTNQCSICNCVMPLKVKLKDSWCPVGYWIQYQEVD
jgi:hypothetical protein